MCVLMRYTSITLWPPKGIQQYCSTSNTWKHRIAFLKSSLAFKLGTTGHLVVQPPINHPGSINDDLHRVDDTQTTRIGSFVYDYLRNHNKKDLTGILKQKHVLTYLSFQVVFRLLAICGRYLKDVNCKTANDSDDA